MRVFFSRYTLKAIVPVCEDQMVERPILAARLFGKITRLESCAEQNLLSWLVYLL